MGANAKLSASTFGVWVAWPQEVAMDITVLALDASGKTRVDGDMCFFNQLKIHDGLVAMNMSGSVGVELVVDLAKAPSGVEKLVVCATMDHGTFGDLSYEMKVQTTLGHVMNVPHAGRSEKAMILAEIYLRNGEWKIKHVSQGFNGGLKDLAEHFGVDVDDGPAEAAAPPAPVPAPADPNAIDLTKKIAAVEDTAPAMVSLIKNVGISLEKKGMTPRRAKVCLCLDISGSMDQLYRSGKIDTLVQRVLGLGLTFDDDGDIDVFLFGRKARNYGIVDVSNYRDFSSNLLKNYRLEPTTNYGIVMEMVRGFYAENNSEGLPVFVMFVTDGASSDMPKTKQMLKDASSEPIFWKFMGIVPQGFWGRHASSFLQELDDMPGRVVDNADFFNVADPADPDDQGFFDDVIEEYPDWIKEAEAKGII
jgi:stress response protein SCP2